jgi:hypothetical protein
MVGDLDVPPIFPSNRTLCPASPSLQWVPWASVPHLHRYYARLRLPAALLRVLRSSLVPRYLACSLLFVSPHTRAGLAVRQKQPHQRRGSWSAGTPTPPAISARRQQALPSSRVAPVGACPALRPRWCPKDIAITPPGLLPSGINKPSAFPPPASQRGYPNDHNCAISGLNHAACTLAPSGFAHPIAGIARGLHY